jgi:hypothetical protein
MDLERMTRKSYADNKEYKKSHTARRKWSKDNDYEVFNWALCKDCWHYKPDPDRPALHGDCKLMEQDGAYPGVMAIAVCNRFMSEMGTDINGKVVEPSLLPARVKTRKNRAGDVFMV